MFGDIDAKTFEAQIASFKSELITLYKRKTKTLSDRETLRFQYLTQGKAKFNSIVSAIYSKLYLDKNVDAQQLVDILIQNLKISIPMTTLDGATIYGWLPTGVLGGRFEIGFFSTPSQLLSDPFNGPSDPDQRPAYKMYSDYFLNQFDTDLMLGNYFLPANQVYDGNAQKSLSFPIPLTLRYVELLLRNSDSPLLRQFDYVSSLFSESYPQAGGSLYDLVEWMRKAFSDIAHQTVTLVQIQLKIDELEMALTDYVNDYSKYSGLSLNASDILRGFQDDSAKSEEEVRTVVPSSVPEQKSKLPWIAAALGIYFFTRE